MAVPAASLSLVHGSAAPHSPDARGSDASFVGLDDRLVQTKPGTSGVLVVRAPATVHAALLAHAARRLRTSGFLPLDPGSGSFAERSDRRSPLFQEIATQLGVASLPTDPQACATMLAHALVAKRAAVVAVLPKHSSWDHAVASELASLDRAMLVFVTSEAERRALSNDVGEAGGETSFELGGELTEQDKLRWLGAIAEEAHAELPSNDLRVLEAWWTRARRSSDPRGLGGHDRAALLEQVEALSPTATAILTCLVLAGRSLSVEALAALGDDAASAVDALVAGGFVTRVLAGDSGFGNAPSRRGLVSLVSGLDSIIAERLEHRAGVAERLATAQLLVPSGSDRSSVPSSAGPGFDPDPWAYARVAELLVSAGSLDAADHAIAKAFRGASDLQATGELAARWFTCVAPVTGDGGIFLRVQAAHRALGMGEANEAQRWCESAAALKPADPTIALLMGKALMQLGDLVAARVCLEKAQAAGSEHEGSQELLAQVASELAELSYLAGHLDVALEQANKAVALATTVSTRLNGRNTIGKINLVQAAWDAADSHFAEDVLMASAAGDGIAELRARLNRGIAMMSKGGLEDARHILTRVLDDGKKVGEDRACAYAFANLGVIASRQHDYASALVYWEQAIRFRHTLRGRIASARTIANLAELRLRLGLVDHAEQALLFGRRLLGQSTTAARASHFAVVAARVALSRGNGEMARREIDAALVDGEAAGDRDYLGEAYRVAARVALDDGDVHRAADAIAKADKLATNDRARADVAVVRALHLRAIGQSALDIASSALSLARAAGEEDLLGEIHTLLAMLHRDAGDLQAAQAHCARAIAVRDQLAVALPVEIRAAFLAKPEIVALSRLQGSLASQDSDLSVDGAEEEAPRTQRIGIRVESVAGPREIIGDDPAIRNLQVAIRKVARANSTVLIRGESGTGKELVAEALHRASERANGPLVSVNCAALVETLLLSELFGHEKGAFTGAASRRRGRFEMAEGGTLFLDEIGDISARTQVALLRVLQEKTFERVGGAQSIRANVRVICATHRDLRAMVERGEFREDLYYRLKGITLEVPPLRARLGDLPKVADHLLGRIALERTETAKDIAPDAMELLQRHRWPGNIRELENVLRAVSLFAEGMTITASDLIDNVEDLRSLAAAGPMSQAPISLRASLLPPPPASSVPVSSSEARTDCDDEETISVALPEGEANATAVAYAQVRHGAVSLSDIKRQIERDCIARALIETKGNITRAAALLGMKRPRLSQLVKQYGLAASAEGSQ